jgi:AAA ATPase domain
MADQVTTGRFVGRTTELAWLHQLLARAGAGEPLVGLVGGEAGVGKTRLVERLAATADGRGVRVLGGGCVPLGEEGLPFAPLVEALRGLAGDLDPGELQAVAGPARAELARLLPDLAWGGEAAAGPPVASRAGQGRLFELLVGVVGRLAERAPLLWVLEDLHWADRSTRDLLAYLATYLRSGRVLVVGTFRSDELQRRHPLRRLLAELARNRRVVRLELARFTRAEVTQQVAALVGADPPARLVDEISARSGGNPFFAEELVLAGGDPGVLPPSPQEVLLARVVRLGDRTQQLLGVAAAAGPGATQPLLAAVAGLDDQQLLAGLHEAVDQQLLRPDPAGGQGYVFRHALVAEAVYGELLAGERVRLHAALAAALEAGIEGGGLEAEDAPASRAARLAHHWAAAGDQPRALAASLAAAAAAEGWMPLPRPGCSWNACWRCGSASPTPRRGRAWTGWGCWRAVGRRPRGLATPPGPRSWSARPWGWSTRRASRGGPGCCTSSWPAACAGWGTLPRWAPSSRRCGWCRPPRRRSGHGCSARWPCSWCWWTASRRREARPRRRPPSPGRSAPGPRRPTPAPRWAAPSSTSATRTRGWPSWRRPTGWLPKPAT